MTDNIPSLSEIANVNTDAGASGIAPEPVIDNSKTVELLNQNARFHAEQVAKKYDTFLQNKKDLFANIGDIQGLETLPEDKEYLRKQGADILSNIMKNPSVITGGKGFDELQGKMAKFKSDAMASKASYLDEKANKEFLARNPDLYTDENVASIESNKKLPIDQRKSVMLKMPTILDEKTLFETALKNSSHPYSEPVEIKGKHYIENGFQVSPDAIQGQMNLALQSQKDKYGHTIESAVKLNYEKLPDDQKQNFEHLAKKNGTKQIEEYWKDRTEKYKNAYLPEGTFDVDPKTGIVKFGKSHTEDKQYQEEQKLNLEKQKLAEKTAYDKARINVDLGELGVKERKLNQATGEDKEGASTVLNEAVSTIHNGTPVNVVGTDGKSHQELRISDPSLLQTFGNIDKDGKTTNVPDAMRYNPQTNQVVLIYGDPNKSGGFGTTKEPIKEIPLDERTWLKTITKRSFPNKDIGGINSLIENILKSNNGSLYEISQKVGKQAETKSQSYNVGGKNYSKEDLNKLGYTDDQIQEAIKLGNIKTK